VITGAFEQVSVVCSEVLCSIQDDSHLEGIMVFDADISDSMPHGGRDENVPPPLLDLKRFQTR